MPESLARPPALNAVGKLTSLKRSVEERCAESDADRVASSPSRTFAERCAAIDRVFAHDAAALVESYVRQA